ncbi:hypothetical protein V2J09_012018 [Rumex salicifolius]
MRNPVVVITGSSSSSIFASHRHYRRISNPKLPIPTFKLQQSSLSPSSSPSSLSSTLSNPLTPPIPSDDGDGEFSQSSLGYYAEFASALVEEGRFVEFGAVVDGLVDLGETETVDFGRLLNLELLASGISKYLGKGRVKGVIQLLSSVAKLRVDVLRLIDGVALKSITMEIEDIRM